MDALSTTVSIAGTKTPLIFGAWFDFDLRDGRTIEHVRIVGRERNGDLRIVGTDDGPEAKLRPSKIAGVRGSVVIPAIADHRAGDPESVRPTASGDGYVCSTKVRLETGFVVDCGLVVERRAGAWRHYVETRSIAALRETKLDRAVDQAIAEENERFLSDPVAIADAQAEGDLYRERLEADGTLPTTPTAFVDQVRDILSAPSARGRYASGREAVRRTLSPRASEQTPVEAVRKTLVRRADESSRRADESADAYLRRIERHPFYAAYIETDDGQALLREAGDEARAARIGGSAPDSTGAHRKPRAASIDIPEGSKRCSGVPKRQIEPHVAKVAEFGAKRTSKDGLASTCRICHKIFAEIGRAKRAAAKEGAK